MAAPLVVVDTAVVVRALTGSENSSSYRLVSSIGGGAFRPTLSDEFLRELSAVVGYPRVEVRIVRTADAFRRALDLGVMGKMYRPHRLDWPSIPDRKDWWMPDLAYESRADYLVSWDPHITKAELPLPVGVVEPPTLLRELGV